MRRLLIAGAAAALLAGCSGQTPSTSPAAALVASYILAANGAAAYETANPASVPAIRACDNAAWALIQPASAALAAGTDPSAAEIAGANAAVTALTPCLTAAGVKQ